MQGFDPSKMDPRVLAELTDLVRRLPPEQISRMQQIMQKSMIGMDTRYELEQLERELPPGFREKLMALMGPGMGGAMGGMAASAQPASRDDIIEVEPHEPSGPVSSIAEARLTVLCAVAEGQMSPEEAASVLWPAS